MLSGLKYRPLLTLARICQKSDGASIFRAFPCRARREVLSGGLVV